MATAKLNKDIFGLSVDNHELVKLAYDAYLANSRSSHAKTLKRGEVRGGGKKPWKQKGTGRARFGSTRNPIWRHGGVAFGRTGEENFTKKISKSAKLQAVRQSLSMANADKLVSVIADFAPKDGKTKNAIKDLNIEAGKNYQIIYKVVPHPYKGQQQVLIVLEVKESGDVVTSFEVTPKVIELLKQFQGIKFKE